MIQKGFARNEEEKNQQKSFSPTFCSPQNVFTKNQNFFIHIFFSPQKYFFIRKKAKKVSRKSRKYWAKNRNSRKSFKQLQIGPNRLTWLQMGPNEYKLIQMCVNLKFLSGHFKIFTVYLGLVFVRKYLHGKMNLNIYTTYHINIREKKKRKKNRRYIRKSSAQRAQIFFW